MSDISLVLGVSLFKHPDVSIIKVGAIPISESKGISLPLSEIPEGMPMGIVVTTDHIAFRLIFYLEHHVFSY